MPESLENLSLKTNQQMQILDQYRVNIYTAELRFNLLLKLLEEKGILVRDEFDKRWPMYLKNDVGAIGPDNIMEGSLKVTMYES